MERLRRIEGEQSDKERLEAINPHFVVQDKKYKTNCGNCVVANELRRKGYDVEAMPGDGMRSAELAEMFDGAKVQSASALSTTDAASEMKQKIEQDILTWGEGARGAIGGDWEVANNGHWFSVEVRDGVVRYEDGQSGEENVKYLERMKPQSVEYVRLDNLKPNDKILNAVKNRRT
ncbi:hypothetical protein R80B4_01952 [Fibrobacteres bacterium R8-0-B4]